MSGECVLCRHVWASSRRPDENFLIFSLPGSVESVDIQYSCLWDADEGDVDTVFLKIRPRDLAAAITTLEDIETIDGQCLTTEGVDPYTRLTLLRSRGNEANVTIICHDATMSAISDIPFAKLLDIRLQLQRILCS